MSSTRHPYRRLAALAVAVLAATAGVAAVPTPAGAAPVGPGSVTRLTSPPGGTAVPVDGRLHGDGYAATVVGVATGTRDGHLSAGPGQTLWKFGLTATVTPAASGGGPVALAATFTVGSGQVPVALPRPGPNGRIGPVWYRASLPTTRGDTTLTLTADDDPQSFALNRMARTGAQPDVSYRADTTATVPAPSGAAVNIPMAATLFESEEDAPLPVRLNSAVLSYEAPDRVDHPAPTTGQAWLTVRLQSNGYAPPGPTPQHEWTYDQAVTASAITLTPAGGAPDHRHDRIRWWG